MKLTTTNDPKRPGIKIYKTQAPISKYSTYFPLIDIVVPSEKYFLKLKSQE